MMASRREAEVESGSVWTRLTHYGTAMAVTSMEEMREAAKYDQLALCNFTYGPLPDPVWNGSDGGTDSGWRVDEPEDCARLLVIDSWDDTVVVHGVISPIVVLLTLVTNTLVCAVLLQRHMRTPTNVFLVALAVSDALTGAIPLPVFLHFYSLGAYRSLIVPPAWCAVYRPMILYLPTAWHTSSIWLTVALAVQRYVYICRQPLAKRLCTVCNAVVAVVVVYVAAVVSQLSCGFEYRYEPFDVDTSIPAGARAGDDVVEATVPVNVSGCYVIPLLAQHRDLYFSIYWYFRVTFIHLTPCVLLVGLNARLFVAMRRAQQHRSRLLRQNRRTESRRLAETNMATLMLVAVVGVFLVVELPLAVMMITMIIENTFDPLRLLDPHGRRSATLIVNVLILFSYPVNFFIYCGMSAQFRTTFYRLFVGGGGGVAAARDAGSSRRCRCQCVDAAADADRADADGATRYDGGGGGGREALTALSAVQAGDEGRALNHDATANNCVAMVELHRASCDGDDEEDSPERTDDHAL